MGRTFCAFGNRITARISQSAGFSISLLIFKYYKKLQNDRISVSFTWLVTKRLLRPVNLEILRFIDLRKCCEQTAFTFWTTLITLPILFTVHSMAREKYSGGGEFWGASGNNVSDHRNYDGAARPKQLQWGLGCCFSYGFSFCLPTEMFLSGILIDSLDFFLLPYLNK